MEMESEDKGQTRTFPAIVDADLEPLLEAVFVEGVGREDDIENDVIEERLEGGDVRAVIGQELSEGVCAREAEGEDLTAQQRLISFKLFFDRARPSLFAV